MQCFTMMNVAMKILLDSHIFLWASANSDMLSEKRCQLMTSPDNTVYVSAVSIAELMIKSSIGKLHIPFDIMEAVQCGHFEHLDFSASDAVLLKTIPMHHRDPFDRMLICQAQSRKLHIMTDDRFFSQYNCQLL